MKEVKSIVRLCGTSLDGTKKVPYALKGVKGIGIMLGHAIAKVAGIDPELRLGQLSDSDLKKIEAVIKNPKKFGIPSWLLNRRRDPNLGEDLLLIGPDLELRVKQDIALMKEIKCWKGIRHSLGLKVRGQKTRTTGRTGRAVGVRRKRGR